MLWHLVNPEHPYARLMGATLTTKTADSGKRSALLGAQLVAEQVIRVGQAVVVEAPSPAGDFGVVFEDDGETGYLYGLDFACKDNPIADALHIYNVADVTDADRPSRLQLFWSEDGRKAAAVINGYTHAVFDFSTKRAYCRTGFPPPSGDWSAHPHTWDDAALDLFR